MKLKLIRTSLFAALSILAASATQAAPSLARTEPDQTIFDRYIKIQTALASDSTKDVAVNATAISQAIRSDTTKALSPQAAQQAEALVKARNLGAAREAFKPLSQSLIQYRMTHPAVAGHYFEAYCPMAKAGWLQAGQAIQNPYFGKSMLRCGSVVQGKGSARSDHSNHH